MRLVPMVLLPSPCSAARMPPAKPRWRPPARRSARAWCARQPHPPRRGPRGAMVHASLGCPEKDTSYAQVVTEGFHVRLRVEDRTFDVRVADQRTVVCGLGTATPGAEADAATTTRLYRAARRDLAERLSVPEKEVRVDFIRPTTWPSGARAASPPRPPRRRPRPFAASPSSSRPAARPTPTCRTWRSSAPARRRRRSRGPRGGRAPPRAAATVWPSAGYRPPWRTARSSPARPAARTR